MSTPKGFGALDVNALDVTIRSRNGMVYVDFGTHLRTVELPPDAAREFAEMLLKHAEAARSPGRIIRHL